MSPEKIAELFHDTYETLAPAYGYETRQETKIFDPQSSNGKLMTATCKLVVEAVLTSHTEELKKKIEGKTTGSSTDEGKAYNQGIRDALAELNHQ